ncbi:hypothetical protein BT63DRAFT_454892 [Microthyrium microscopicum]|uniref:Ras modification protein ERF4 n=1 Tax=Microthyrium microscopicum TaxID=703497 RepID=A0A6A6UBE4_9PEZI|nr:hypothetical protein BT63DRAFT_454892 [Microthyrium microscopicum]
MSNDNPDSPPLSRHGQILDSQISPPLPSSPISPQSRPRRSSWRPFQINSPFTPAAIGRPVTPRRPPAARLWNPQNFSPRSPAVPNVPVTPLPVDAHRNPRDEHPLLTLPEQRRSRQSFQSLRLSPSTSLVVEHESSNDRSGSDTVPVPSTVHKGKEPAAGQGSPNTGIGAQQVANMPPNESKPDMPYPIGLSDVEAVPDQRLRHTPSKVSLPMLQADTGAQQQDGDRQSNDGESAIEWGPAHPCYPHMNPHVPTTSPLYSSTRIIRIPRDWMMVGDLAPTFANVYPEVLDNLFSEEEFRKVLRHVNEVLMSAFNPFGARAWLDTILGVATFWLWDDLGMTGVKSQLKKLEQWIESWNRDIGAKDGVQIIPLRRTGYMSMDIQIPDPQISQDPVSRPATALTDFNPPSPYGLENIPPRVAAAA